MRSCSSSPTRWKGASYETPPQQAHAALGEVSHVGHKVSHGMPTRGREVVPVVSRVLDHISQKMLCLATHPLTKAALTHHGP